MCGERAEGALEWGCDGTEGRNGGSQGRAEEAVVSPREAERDPQAEIGDAVAEASRNPFDEAVEAQPAQLIGDGSLCDRRPIQPRQAGKLLPQIGRPEALRQLNMMRACKRACAF